MLSERISRFAKGIVQGVGIVLVVAWPAARIQGETLRRTPLRRLHKVRSVAASIALTSPTSVDDHLWSVKRVRAYRESLTREFPPPLAVLRIPCAGIEVPVL